MKNVQFYHFSVLQSFKSLSDSIAVYVVDSSPNLPSLWERSPHVCRILTCEDLANSLVLQIVVLRQLNYLQTIVIDWRPVRCGHVVDQQCAQKEQRAKDNWIGLAKNILTQVQLRDNLEKSIVVRSEDELERRILLKPAPFGFEEGSLEPWRHVATRFFNRVIVVPIFQLFIYKLTPQMSYNDR